MIDRICAQLREQGDDLRIQGIVKTEKMYLVTLSDKYGNNMDMSPLGFDIESGKEVYVEYDFDSSGINCIVPEAYRTYRDIVYSQLCENTPDHIVNELGPYGISYAINVVFLEYISDISISQLYDICNYMIFLIAFSCTMEEKSSFMLLMANDAIKSFLRMPNSEKLKHVVEWAKESELDTELDTELVGHDSFGFGYSSLENGKLLTPQFKPFGVDSPFSDAAKFGDKPFKPTQVASNKKGKGIKE